MDVQYLNLTQFYFLLDVPVPCFTPAMCDQFSHREIELVAGSNSLAVISNYGSRYLPIFLQNKQLINSKFFLTGRFNLKNASFVCKSCKYSTDAKASDYIFSGYWPSSPGIGSYLFTEELLLTWLHTQHKAPGTSETKFIEIRQLISMEYGRVSKTNYGKLLSFGTTFN